MCSIASAALRIDSSAVASNSGISAGSGSMALAMRHGPVRSSQMTTAKGAVAINAVRQWLGMIDSPEDSPISERSDP
jgi:hypothetical protein